MKHNGNLSVIKKYIYVTVNISVKICFFLLYYNEMYVFLRLFFSLSKNLINFQNKINNISTGLNVNVISEYLTAQVLHIQ